MGIFTLFKPNVKKMKAKRDINGLVNALNHKNEKVQEEAAEAILKFGKSAFEPLTIALKESKLSTRKKIADTLEKANWQPENDEEKAYVLIAKENWDLLSELGEPAIHPLIHIFGWVSDWDSKIGLKIVEILKDIGEPAVNPLIKALEINIPESPGFARNYNHKTGVSIALGEIGDSRAVEPLIEFLNIEKYHRLKWEAANALGKLKDTRAVEPLINAILTIEYRQAISDSLAQADWPGAGAIWALGEIGDERAIQPLINQLFIDPVHTNPIIQGKRLSIMDESKRALVKIGEPAVEPLIEMLKPEKTRNPGSMVVSTLGELGDLRAIAPLIDLSKDKRRNVGIQEDIEKALKKIEAKNSQGVPR